MTPVTRPTKASVTEFLDSVADARRRADGHAARAIFERATGAPAVMWGTAIVGFGSAPVTNSTGTLDWPVVGFSPRKAALTLYGIQEDGASADPALLERLGPHESSVACVYIKRLDAIDLGVLEELVRQAWERPRD